MKNFSPGEWLLLFVVLTVLCLVYLIPWTVARYRGHPHQASIAVINLLLGWSLLGWAVALAWAVAPIPGQRQPYRL